MRMITMRKIVVAALLSSATSSYGIGYGSKELIGAWAPESAPDKPVIVVEERRAWMLVDGQWRFIQYLNSDNGGVEFNCLRSGDEVCYKLGTQWSGNESLRSRLGLKCQADTVLLVNQAIENRKVSDGDVMAVVKSAPPDWNSICKADAFIGTWRDDEGHVLVVRPDGYATMTNERYSVRDRNPKPFLVRSWKCYGAGLELSELRREDNGAEVIKKPREVVVFCDSGDTLCVLDWASGFWATRSKDAVDDGLDARLAMVKDGAYHGSWGVSVGFKIFSVHFDRDGKGMASAFMGASFFDWKAETNGWIRCTVAEDGDIAASGAVEKDFRCHYDPLTDTMLVTGCMRSISTHPKNSLLPLQSRNPPPIKDMLKRFEELKKDPRWQAERKRFSRNPAGAKKP